MKELNGYLASLPKKEQKLIKERYKELVKEEEERRMGKKKFKGYDYEELAKYFGVKLGDEFDELEAIQPLADKLEEVYLDAIDKGDKFTKDVKACRRFLKALYENGKDKNYDAVVWAGLLEVENASDFMKIFIALLPYLWV